MTMTPNDPADRLRDEEAELDVPALPISDVIMLLCEADTEGNNYAAYFDALTGEGSKTNLQLIAADLLDFAIESSTQLPHVRRALEIADEIEDIDNQESSGRHGL